LNDKIEEDEIGWSCGRHGREEKCIQRLADSSLKEIRHLQHLSVDRSIILKLILKKIGYMVVDWIRLRTTENISRIL
jgi:hypothetical protein